MNTNLNREDASLLNIFDIEDKGFIDSEYIELFNIEKLDFQYHDLIVLHLNIRGLYSKKDNLKYLLDVMANRNYHVDVILLCETFINEDTQKLCEIEGYHFEKEFRKMKTKGGVGIYISNELKYINRKDLAFFIEGKVESCFIEVINKQGKNIIMGEVYRIPNTDPTLLTENYKTLFKKIKEEKKELIIGTDQNLDFLKLHSHFDTNKLFDLLLSNGIYPSITKPTRITHSTATLIDNIYVSDTFMNNYKSCIVEYDISDHLPCMIAIKNVLLNRNDYKQKFKIRKFNEKNIIEFKKELIKLDQTSLNEFNCQEAYDKLTNHIQKAMNKTCPEITITVNKKQQTGQPWMTKGLKKSSNKCNKLYKQTIGKRKNDVSVINYTRYRNIFNKVKIKSKIEYYNSRINLFKNNSKKLWNIYNRLLGKINNKKETVDYIKIDNIKLFGNKEIADNFSRYFASVGVDLANKIQNSRKPYDSYLSQANNNSIFFTPTTAEEIENIVSKFQNKTSCGVDELSNQVLKKIIKAISNPLQIVFNKSISEGKVPNEMKNAIITPIHKAKSRSEISNYRPVSVLTSISKILEKIVYKRMYGFLQSNNILYESQYGFRSNMSTVDAITELIGSIIKNLDQKKFSLVIYLDLSKAFDTVNHKILLNKLYHYGIRGVCHDWFKDYLTDRKHKVKIQKDDKITYSNFNSISTGVPQGSVLGPLLFLIYINDLNNSLEIMKSINFADDTNLICSNTDIDDLFIDVQYDIENVLDWFRSNKLSVNIDKTCYMVFRPRGKNFIPILNRIKVDNTVLKEVECTKFLGIWINNKLNWTEQIYHVKSKLHQCEFILSKIKLLLPEYSLRTIYFAHALSHILYGIKIWGCMLNETQLRILRSAQLRCLLLFKHDDTQRNNLFKNLKFLEIKDLVRLDLLKMAYKYMHNQLPQNISQLFPKPVTHKYQTRNKGIPNISKHKSAIFSKSFLTEMNTIWTNTSFKIKGAKSLKMMSKLYYAEKFN